jgi:hypothetical protein
VVGGAVGQRPVCQTGWESWNSTRRDPSEGRVGTVLLRGSEFDRHGLTSMCVWRYADAHAADVSHISKLFAPWLSLEVGSHSG